MNKIVDCTLIAEEVIEYFKQQIFPDDAAVVMYKLRHRYEPRLALDADLDYTELVTGEEINPADLNCIRVPYETLGELQHALFLINSCWELLFRLPGECIQGVGSETRAFVYRGVFFFRKSRRRISYVPNDKMWGYMR